MQDADQAAEQSAKLRAHKQRITRAMRYLAVAAAALGGVLFFLFVTASANSPFGDRNYAMLLWLNAALLAVLLVTVTVLALRLWQRRRDGKFGARLMIRFAMTFALAGVIPGVLIYFVSGQFLARSLDSWFNVRIEGALDAGLSLGRAAIEAQKSDLTNRARALANELGDASPAAQVSILNRLRERGQVTDAVLFTANGRVIASSGTSMSLSPDLPSAQNMASLRVTRMLVLLESEADRPGARDLADRTAGDAGASAGEPGAAVRLPMHDDLGTLRVRVVVPVTQMRGGLFASEPTYLQLIQSIPGSLGQNAQNVESVSQDYRQIALGREGLRRIYSITLTMSLLLAVFGALVVALLLAARFAKPLLTLAEGTRAVAGGDFRPLPLPTVQDEIGALTESFNAMTAQLADARETVQAREVQLQRTNHFLSSVLGNITTGVVVLDGRSRLVSVNGAAERILGQALHEKVGSLVSDVAMLGAIGAALLDRFQVADPSSTQTVWQQQFEFERPDASPLAVLARGSRLGPLAGVEDRSASIGYVIAFDDITEVISAQRAVAWSEVARRLAHEIKNPLTPIQLSAERLERKLADKLGGDDLALLRKSTETIVAQVSAMKHMVNEFREYARMPAAELVPIDLNLLVDEVLALYAGAEHAPRAELAPGLPLVEGDATQLRQVIHNLLQNAQDAVAAMRAEAGSAAHPQAPDDVVVRSKRIEYSPVETIPRVAKVAVRLEVQDRGAGFSPRILARAFEPYVTTKARGTGLGLAIVRKIVEEHGAHIEINNAEGGGAVVAITFVRVVPRK
jgi:nitrogen fixation/metabolism regulation signal transduction histidine kinase